MTTKVKTVPLPPPKAPSGGVPAAFAISGPPIPPIERIKLYSAETWEEFITEWVESLRDAYRTVERCGGAGDMGRDIVAVSAEDRDLWDNYQCKHYAKPLKPSEVWVEFGKLAYYTKSGAYSYPRRYFFVAPQGCGTTLSNLLKKPEELRSELFGNWERYCKGKITKTESVELDSELKSYVEGLDFSIFSAVQPLRVIEQHAKTRWHVHRFGGGLPARPPASMPPANLENHEANYVRALLNAYGDHLNTSFADIVQCANIDLQEHFADARLEFYSAESLRAFSRDTLPPGEFEALQDEVHGGIRDEIRHPHVDGYQRLLAVVKLARCFQLSARALGSQVTQRDRGGICHQLANDLKVKWVKR